MVRTFRPEPDTRAVIKPKPAALWLFVWDFQPFTSPDAFDTFVVYAPARLTQQGRDPAVAVTTVLPSQLDDISGEPSFIGTALRNLPLGRAVLAKRATGAALTHAKGLPHAINAKTTTRRA